MPKKEKGRSPAAQSKNTFGQYSAPENIKPARIARKAKRTWKRGRE